MLVELEIFGQTELGNESSILRSPPYEGLEPARSVAFAGPHEIATGGLEPQGLRIGHLAAVFRTRIVAAAGLLQRYDTGDTDRVDAASIETDVSGVETCGSPFRSVIAQQVPDVCRRIAIGTGYAAEESGEPVCPARHHGAAEEAQRGSRHGRRSCARRFSGALTGNPRGN